MLSFQRPSEVVLPPLLPAGLKSPQAGLVTCSICLRVQRGSNWVEAEEAIRDLRTFDLSAPVRLEAGICAGCGDGIAERRGRVSRHALAKAA
jgi:hypothetical protein